MFPDYWDMLNTFDENQNVRFSNPPLAVFKYVLKRKITL